MIFKFSGNLYKVSGIQYLVFDANTSFSKALISSFSKDNIYN
jgi:hypothetical protein